MQTPTVGTTVLYTLTDSDAFAINKRRLDAQNNLPLHIKNSNGVQVHIGNSATVGEVYPMMITRVWSQNNPTAPVNGQVFLDGNPLT